MAQSGILFQLPYKYYPPPHVGPLLVVFPPWGNHYSKIIKQIDLKEHDESLRLPYLIVERGGRGWGKEKTRFKY